MNAVPIVPTEYRYKAKHRGGPLLEGKIFASNEGEALARIKALGYVDIEIQTKEFGYTAKNRKNETVKNSIGAVDTDDAMRRLRDQGYTDIQTWDAAKAWKQEKKTIAPQEIQHQYTNCRIHEIMGDYPDLRVQTIKLLASKGGSSDEQMEKQYDKMQKYLQKCELTINFHACRWFQTENKYESFISMYQIGQATPEGKIAIKGDAKNPVEMRVAADTFTQFGSEEWTGYTPKRGQMPIKGEEVQKVRIMNRMQPGSYIPTSLLDKNELIMKSIGDGAFVSANQGFDAKTMQIFAGLNFAKRPHGSSIDYGHSYFVLKPGFKINALYYPCDTFNNLTLGANAAASFGSLGTIYLKAKLAQNVPMLAQLWECCLFKGKLKDSADPADILEAHLYEKVLFGDVEKLVLCLRPPYKDSSGNDLNLSKNDIDNMRKNCRTFADKWGIEAVMCPHCKH